MSISNYAKALYQIAKEQDKVSLITFQFEDFKLIMAQNDGWVQMIDSPMMTMDNKIKMIDALNYDASFLSFVKMLASKRLVHLYLEIFDEWIHMSDIYQKIAHIHIYTAKPITEAQLESLKKVIQPRFPNQKLDLYITIDEHLLGGIKIVHQGQSLDRSIARELKELYTRI